MEFNTLNKEIFNLIKEGLSKDYSYDLDYSKFELTRTKDIKKGDLTTNISMKLAKELKQKPFELADKIVSYLSDYPHFSKVEKVMPGFINIYFTSDFFEVIVKDIVSKSGTYGKQNSDYDTKTINFEFISANPTGELHVGHIRQGVIGDVTCRILEYLGNDVTRGYYLNDLGVQILNLGGSVYYHYLSAIGEKTDIESADYNTPEIIEFAQHLAKKDNDKYSQKNMSKEDAINAIKDLALLHFIEIIKLRVNELGIKEFDEWYSEKNIFNMPIASKVLSDFEKNGHSFEKDGALWLKTTDFGDDYDRVMVKSDGMQTYFLPDITNHYLKFTSDKKYDLVIDLFGADHHGYEKRMNAAISKMGFDDSKFRIDFIQMVMVKDNGQVVKMSKRAGTSVRAKDMLKDLGKDLIRFYITDRSREQHLELEVNAIKEESFDNPYYYMQYSSARANKLLKDSLKIKESKDNVDTYENEFTRKLIISMFTINNVLISSSRQDEPYIINLYLRELASDFHKFYSTTKVIEDGIVLSQNKNITEAFVNVFNITTSLLGITPLKEM